MEKLFANEVITNFQLNVNLEVRAMLAWELIKTHPNIAGVENGEDATGRAKLKLQTPAELVDRSFAIADYFFEVAEKRGDLKQLTLSNEEKARARGEIASIEQDATYSFVREKKDRERAQKST